MIFFLRLDAIPRNNTPSGLGNAPTLFPEEPDINVRHDGCFLPTGVHTVEVLRQRESGKNSGIPPMGEGKGTGRLKESSFEANSEQTRMISPIYAAVAYRIVSYVPGV